MKVKKFFKILLNIFLVFITIVELLIIANVIYSRATGGFPNIFGYNLYEIISPSMEPEINVGDVIISKSYEGEELSVGQVITFHGRKGDLAGKIVTHKIVKIEETENGIEITTRGIANSKDDPAITQDDVISVMVYKTVVISFIYQIIDTVPGFIFLVIVPLVLLITTEVIQLVKAFRNKDEEDEENVESDESTEISENNEEGEENNDERNEKQK